MFIIRKILLYLNPILFIISLELIRTQGSFWWIFLLVNLLLLTVTLWEFSKRVLNHRLANFLVAPFVFIITVFGFLMFFENDLIYRFVYLIAAVFIYLYLEQTLNYFYFTNKYQPYTLENLSLYINVLSVFFLTSSIFSSLIFLRLSVIISAIIIYLIIFILTHQISWSNKLIWHDYKIFCVIISLIIAEIFFVVSYLPLNFYVNALLVSIVFYVVVSLSRLFLLRSLDKKNVLEHLIVSSVAVVLILLTAQWN